MSGGGSPKGAPPDPRNPQVYVYSNGPTDCAIVVNPDVIVFPNSGHANAFPIIWRLQTKGYSFAQNNNLASPVPLHGSPQGVINGCRSGGNAMQCTNNDTRKGIWKYTIAVVAEAGVCQPPLLDPIISND